VLKSFSGPWPEGQRALGISADDFLRPGKLAALGHLGLQADPAGGRRDWAASRASSRTSSRSSSCWSWRLFVIVAFFIIAVQVFVVLIEFKLVTLAGFVLVPFGLFGRTAFLAEKVLGNVIASGVKVMVLAVIVGIGSSLFCRVQQRRQPASRPWKRSWPWPWPP
jgi:type IV secretion system protein TrbL